MASILTTPLVYEPTEGYNLVASYIDKADWTTFWRQNEAPFVDEWIRSLTTGRGLDAGSGTGPYLPTIVKAGQCLVAFDSSVEMLTQNQRKYSHHLRYCAQVDYRLGSLELPLPFADHEFDWILCTRVLSHINNLPGLLSEFNRVLQPRGVCLLSDVHPQHPYNHTGFTIFPDPVAYPKGYKINIQTRKHSVEMLLKTSVENGYSVEEFREFTLEDLLQQPDSSTFDKLYTQPDRKIFYILSLSKMSC